MTTGKKNQYIQAIADHLYRANNSGYFIYFVFHPLLYDHIAFKLIRAAIWGVGRSALLAVLRVFIINSCIVRKLCIFKVILDDFFRYLKIHYEITNFHSAATNTATITGAQPGPAKSFIHFIFEPVTLFYIFTTTHAINFVFY